MPPAVVERLNAAVNRFLADPKVIEAHASLGAVGLPMTQAAFRDLIAAEIARHAEVVKAAGVSPE